LRVGFTFDIIANEMKHAKTKQIFTNVVWKEDKYFVVQCLNVDVSSFGKTYEEALKNLEEALELYLEDAPQRSIKQIEKPSLFISEPGLVSYA
jgi:predicted RNase H-like HicB family nuclease